MSTQAGAATSESQGSATIVNTPASVAGAMKPEQQQEEKLLAGKFKDPNSLEQAYLELQRKLGEGGTSEQEGEGTGDGKTSEQTENEGEEDQKAESPYDPGTTEAISKAGLDPTAIAKEWTENGKLSDQSYAAFEAAGYSRAMVDSHIEVLQAKQQQAQQQAQQQTEAKATAIYGVTGGEDGYKEMISWAAQNLTTEEIAAFNEAVEGSNVGVARLAVQGLYASFTGDRGKAPRLTTGASAGRTVSDTFRSVGELTAAQRDPRYRTDAAYRREVEQKAMRSNLFNR